MYRRQKTLIHCKKILYNKVKAGNLLEAEVVYFQMGWTTLSSEGDFFSGSCWHPQAKREPGSRWFWKQVPLIRGALNSFTDLQITYADKQSKSKYNWNTIKTFFRIRTCARWYKEEEQKEKQYMTIFNSRKITNQHFTNKNKSYSM